MANVTFWRGNNEFDRFRREMDRMFNAFFGNVNYAPGYTMSDNTTWTPTCELIETDKTFVIRADLPGLYEKDIDVQVASNQLSIKGEKKSEWDETKGAYHFTERTFGTFYRTFTLPSTVDTTKIRARYDRGVLEVELPKTTTAALTKVKVEQK
jgi:HSP20 family protein